MSPMESTAAALRAPTTALRAPGAVHAVDVVKPHDRISMNRSERFGFWLYVAMGTFCMAVLIAAATSAIVA